MTYHIEQESSFSSCSPAASPLVIFCVLFVCFFLVCSNKKKIVICCGKPEQRQIMDEEEALAWLWAAPTAGQVFAENPEECRARLESRRQLFGQALGLPTGTGSDASPELQTTHLGSKTAFFHVAGTNGKVCFPLLLLLFLLNINQFIILLNIIISTHKNKSMLMLA